MYFYFYDSFLKERKYAGLLTKIENRLIDLGINGKIEKMNVLKSAKEVIADAVKNKADSIIAVGDDKTFANILKIIAPYKNVVLGFIPVAPGNISKMLGIPIKEEACNTLSARIVSGIDLGKVNSHYFFSALELPRGNNISIECDGKYTVRPTSRGVNISIQNFGLVLNKKNLQKDDVHNPADGYLDVVFSSEGDGGLFKAKSGQRASIFPVKKVAIKSPGESLAVTSDGVDDLKTPINVSVVPKKLRVIVGKERLF